MGLRWLAEILSSSKSTPNSYKFASINFETEKMENYHDGECRCLDRSGYQKPRLFRCYLVSLLSNVSYVIQHEKDADTVLICHGSEFQRVEDHRDRTIFPFAR